MFSFIPSDLKSHPANEQAEKPSSETPWCDRIYQAAKNSNTSIAKVEIQQILKYATIDVRHHKTDDTAVSKLAAEGNVKAVNFLRKEFNASLMWVIYGYGRCGTESAEIKKIFQEQLIDIQRVSKEKFLK